MKLDEIMRLINQGLFNQSMDAPERDKSFRALGALQSRIDYTTPGYILEIRPDGFTRLNIFKPQMTIRNNSEDDLHYIKEEEVTPSAVTGPMGRQIRFLAKGMMSSWYGQLMLSWEETEILSDVLLEELHQRRLNMALVETKAEPEERMVEQNRMDNPGLRGKLEWFAAKVRSGFIKEEDDEKEITKIIALSPDCYDCPIFKDLEEVAHRRPDYTVANCILYLKYKMGKP